MRFANPEILLLILLVVPLLIFFKSKGASVKFSSLTHIKYLKNLERTGEKPSSWKNIVPAVLRILICVLVIVAIARPQEGKKEIEVSSEGVDIILTLDTSGSMRALDFTVKEKRATRLSAVKEVVAKFIEKRVGDRIGMVVFGDVAFTAVPLTLDHELLLTLLNELEIGMAGEATAIGDALAVSANRLKDLKAKSKIMVLLTDGRNNAGNILPLKSAEIAKSFGIKIYTIGVGTNEPAPFMVDTIFGKKLVYERVELDEKTLRKIAKITDARYFRATDTKKLEEIYDEINKLEKTSAKVKEYMEYKELYYWILALAIILLLIEIVLNRTVLRKVP